jgi:selenocysteine lyase/cysteine desulfurase
MLSCQQSLFSLPEHVHYLNCAYMSPMLKSVEEAGVRGMLRKRTPYSITTNDFFQEPQTARTLIARLINAPDAGTIALIPSVSYGMAIVAKNVRLQRGQHILSVGEEFPSGVYAWKQHLHSENDTTMRFVPPPATLHERGRLWNEEILNAITPATAVVVISSVHWTDGTLFDLAAIRKRTREVGALFVIDGTQSVGALPLDVAQIQPDALICGSYKCMMGPYSLGFAYLGEYFLNGLPLEETWVARKGSEDFRKLVEYQDEYQPAMSRYNVGEQSNFVLVPMLIAAVEQLLAWTPEAVQQYCRQITSEFFAWAATTPLWVEHEHCRSAHLFGVRLPQEVDITALQQALTARNIMISVRGNALRIAPNVYNSADDMKALREVLAQFL